MPREQRRLAAIVAADVVGYTRLMGRDERGTLAALKALRRELIDPTIIEHGGRIVKSTGDGLLLEFPSVVDATHCAVALQNGMARQNAGVADGDRLLLRIGINAGDIIIDGDDIFGDGVNLAARLEPLADPGGICISDRVYRDVRGRLEADFIDGGEQALKNIAEPVRIWRWTASSSRRPMPIAASAPALELPDKPSIAVLPFTNMSGDPEQEYFTDGITEDIITELSRFRSLFVIARNSTFTYKGKAVDVRQVGKDLGIRYVLEGSIRKAGNRVRVTGQLTDAHTGNHVWAERYDRVLEDIFAVQEEITHSIVAAVAPEVEASELTQLGRRRPDSLRAYEIALQAMAAGRSGWARTDAATIERAIGLANAALAIDPKCVRALTALGIAHFVQVDLRLITPPDAPLAAAVAALDRAIELDRLNHEPHQFKGMVLGKVGRSDDAMIALTRARELNPNDASTLSQLGLAEVFLGDAAAGTAHLMQSLRLNPRDPWTNGTYLGLAAACFVRREYLDAIQWALLARNDISRNVVVANSLALGYVGSGQIEAARAEVEIMRRVGPGYLAERLAGFSTYKLPRDRERSLLFLRIAAGLEDPGSAEKYR